MLKNVLYTTLHEAVYIMPFSLFVCLDRVVVQYLVLIARKSPICEADLSSHLFLSVLFVSVRSA